MQPSWGRKRWGLSGVLSIGTHLVVVIAFLVGAGSRYDRVNGHGVHELAEKVIDFDLVPAVEAAPVAEQIVGPPAPPPAMIPTPRRGRAMPRQRPITEPAIRMPASADPLEPPSLAAPLGEDDGDADADEEAAPPPPAPAVASASSSEPVSIPAPEATYLRTYETFPSLPRSLWVSGRVYSVLAQVCVSTDGRVANVAIKRGAAPELDRAVMSTLQSWRYRPRLVEGTPRPFCHLLKLEFSLH
jgi:protein TonB